MKIEGRRLADARAARLARNGRTLLIASGVTAVFTGVHVAGAGGVTALAGQLAAGFVVLSALAVVCYVLAAQAERAAETAWRVAELQRRGVRVVVGRRPERDQMTGQEAADLVQRARARKDAADRARRAMEDFERAQLDEARLAAFEREEWLADLADKAEPTVSNGRDVELSRSRAGGRLPRPRDLRQVERQNARTPEPENYS